MKLSIITINWNNREGLRATMENVLGQSARDQFEYIVVDGGAPDGSGEMLASEFDGRLDKWVSEPIKPIYKKMNMGVEMATGDYLLFLNSGDALNDPDVVRDVLPALDGEKDLINRAYMVFVALDDDDKPIPLPEKYTPETLEEQYEFSAALNRKEIRKQERAENNRIERLCETQN